LLEGREAPGKIQIKHSAHLAIIYKTKIIINLCL